ncbi:hypothetical protein LDHU3_24.1410:CDS1 [Leishmania donovani]|nr:hypothetical protein LDHU3_24.1410:CDS1 [Leishmania donovani]
MTSGSTSMQMLLAHQYMHSLPTTPQVDRPASVAHAQPTSPLRRRRRRLPFSAPNTSTLLSGDGVPFLYSSVNHLTHRLPETLGVHYPESPYYVGRNEFDTQLLREAVASRRGQPMQRAQTASPGARVVPAASQQRQYAQAMPTRPIDGTITLSGLSLPRLCKQSPGNTASVMRHTACHRSFAGTCTSELDQPIVSLQSTTARSRSIRPATSDAAAVTSETIPEPCMRCRVRWEASIVRDELAADRLAQFRRLVSTVTT